MSRCFLVRPLRIELRKDRITALYMPVVPLSRTHMGHPEHSL
jgi:hypothetical protein